MYLDGAVSTAKLVERGQNPGADESVTQKANCTYAPLSENKYLSTMIDSGQALTVRIMLPLGEYGAYVPLAVSVS